MNYLETIVSEKRQTGKVYKNNKFRKKGIQSNKWNSNRTRGKLNKNSS